MALSRISQLSLQPNSLTDPQATSELSASLPMESTKEPDAAAGRVFFTAWHLGSVMALCVMCPSRSSYSVAEDRHKGN